MAAATANIGNPFAACHTRFGAQSSSATAPPSHGHRERSAARGPTASTPISSAPSRNAGSTRSPARCPPPPRRRATPPPTPSRSARTSHRDQAVHISRSTVVVDSRWPTAGSTWRRPCRRRRAPAPPRPAPNSRASSPVSSTTSPAISADGREPDQRTVEQRVDGVGQQRGERGLVGVAERGSDRRARSTARRGGSRSGRPRPAAAPPRRRPGRQTGPCHRWRRGGDADGIGHRGRSGFVARSRAQPGSAPRSDYMCRPPLTE